MIADQLNYFQNELAPSGCKLIPVSKTKPNDVLMEAYNAGCRVFGENKVQELAAKHEALPKDIEWHFIGHLQRNKIKYISSFVYLIHAVDSLRLLSAINKEAAKYDRVIKCLLQVHIASEETKFGFSAPEVIELIKTTDWSAFKNIEIVGLMGMATYTSNTAQIKSEFQILSGLKREIERMALPDNIIMKELSMGMTNDYRIALEEGSTMVRIGTAIFGERDCKLDE